MRHLNASDRLAIRQQLDLLKGQVLEELRASAPSAHLMPVEDAHEVKTHADEAEAERAADVYMAEVEVDYTRLEEIERALGRMEDGRYGICEDCGTEIPRARLLAQPAAVRCIACQTAAEARHRI
jgi:DnaK suppressor protein